MVVVLRQVLSGFDVGVGWVGVKRGERELFGSDVMTLGKFIPKGNFCTHLLWGWDDVLNISCLVSV